MIGLRIANGARSRLTSRLAMFLAVLGREKSGCSVMEQLSDELGQRGFDTADLTTSLEEHGWVKVRANEASTDARTNHDKLGYRVTLTFREPVSGPVSLGASSHFGLGLFVPVTD